MARQPPSFGSLVAEVAGATAAECTAVCCCAPCVVASVVVLTVVKVPAGLCRKAMNKGKKKWGVGLLQPKRYEDNELSVGPVSWGALPEKSASREVLDMEMEMWGKFYSTATTTGFWRNPSEREHI